MDNTSSPASFPELPVVGNMQPSPRLAGFIRPALQSVGVLHATKRIVGKEATSFATSFCVDERGWFLTALHYLDGLTSSFIVTDRLYETELVAIKDEQDMALVVVKSPQGRFQPLKFAASLPTKGAPVLGLGYPAAGLGILLHAFAAVYQGRFADGVQCDDREIACPGLPAALCFTGSGLDLPGFSGGPILTEEGKVVAVTAMGDGDEFVAGVSAGDALSFVEWYRSRIDRCDSGQS